VAERLHHLPREPWDEEDIWRTKANGSLFAALPALLAHCAIIKTTAMVMSIIGGLLIYGTIISFTLFFQEEAEF
jgi:hypothetical protein